MLAVTAIVDANVAVSGVIAPSPEAATWRILNAMLSGELHFLLNDVLLAEYEDSLARPRISKRHGLNAHGIAGILVRLIELADVVSPSRANLAAPDRGDDHLWALLAERPEAVLVTGDGLLLRSTDWPGRVITPRAFADAWLAD